MIKEIIVQAINDQIKLEEESSRLYLAMASWCDANGFPGTAAFLYAHSDEERLHQFKLIKYVNERGGHAQCMALEHPENNYLSLHQIFEHIYAHEQMITAKINALYDLAFKEKDFNTGQFLQWFIMEQDEEEAIFSGILDQLNLIGDSKGAL
ncbi:MAG: ferritin, partial [Bacteroidia bacterium]|nr:ferritin [Bacteroidales bacterium]NCD42990.1 ferritin [Bacteroidia bacterium]